MSTAAQFARAIPIPRLPAVEQLVFHERSWLRWLMVSIDIVALEICLLLGLLVRLSLSSYFSGQIGWQQFTGLTIGVLLVPVVQYCLDIYPGYCFGPVERLRRRTYATVSVFGALTVWDNLVLRGTWSRGVLLATLFFAAVLPPVTEVLARKILIQKGHWGIPALILGGGRTGAAIVETLQRNPEFGLVPVAIHDDDAEKWRTNIHGVPVIGPLRMAYGAKGSAEAAVLAMPEFEPSRVYQLTRDLCISRMIVVPDLAGIQTHWVRACDLGGHLALELTKHLHVPKNRVVKRTLDYVIGVPALLLTAPLVALLAIWIRRSSPGPALYSQEREGSYGQTIRIWKLRTMHVKADEMLEDYLQQHPKEREQWQRFFKLKHDPRVIPGIGNFLRRTSLDELPQLWNVVKGEMSLVGPRPFPAYHLHQFQQEFRCLRRSVLPGLTGLWQVSSRSDGDLKVQESLDTYYIRNWSVWLDIYLITRTVVAVLGRSGAY